MRNEFTAIIEAAPKGGYFAYCPEISGANGQGETIDECRHNLGEAIALILEDRREVCESVVIEKLFAASELSYACSCSKIFI